MTIRQQASRRQDVKENKTKYDNGNGDKDNTNEQNNKDNKADGDNKEITSDTNKNDNIDHKDKYTARMEVAKTKMAQHLANEENDNKGDDKNKKTKKKDKNGGGCLRCPT